CPARRPADRHAQPRGAGAARAPRKGLSRRIIQKPAAKRAFLFVVTAEVLPGHRRALGPVWLCDYWCSSPPGSSRWSKSRGEMDCRDKPGNDDGAEAGLSNEVTRKGLSPRAFPASVHGWPRPPATSARQNLPFRKPDEFRFR